MDQPSARAYVARALDLPPQDRDAFLARECGDDPDLRLEVQRLLIDSEKALAFSADTEGATIGAEDFDANYAESEGDEIGPYTLRQQIGEGGFGTVWMAEQSTPISRMVALKVVKAGMDTRQVLSRFEAERQVLAMMDHRNIARILDAGATPAGRPYFAMELVKGVPITGFCREQKLDTTERLALFQDVCSAINHAHQKGIIHRDLKPSNVMVTLEADRPVAKVIDFGIAKATQNKLTEKTLFTRFEQFLGTPAYMSPEQAAMSNLDIDTRSDIYSLGVLLYELLAGSPPFDQKSLLSAGYDEMRRIIAEDEPPKPSTRVTQTKATRGTPGARTSRINATSLKGDLDWIVMKAIEKDRTRRYETADAFAADIGRFLEDKPVLAAAPGASYKFKKFARRNKATLGIVSTMVLLLLTGIVTTTWQAVRATAAEEKAIETLTIVSAERDAKIAALGDAEASSKFLSDMFESPEPGAEKGGREVKVVEVLDRASMQLDNETGMPQKRRAMLRGSLGNTYFRLGLYNEAIALQEQVYKYHLDIDGSEHPDTLDAMHNLARSYGAAGRSDEALKLGEILLPLSRRIHGPEHPKTLKAMGNLASFYRGTHRMEEALEMREKTLALCHKRLGRDHPDTIISMGNLTRSYLEAGRRDEALDMGRQVLALSRRVHGPEHPRTLWAMRNLANSYHETGRQDEALEMREEVLALRRKISGPEHPDTLRAMHNLAKSYHAAGHHDEALEMREELLALRHKLHGPEHPDTLMAKGSLANSYGAVGRHDEALEMREDVLELLRKVSGPEHPATLMFMDSLAASYCDAGRWEDAVKILAELLAIRGKESGPEHPDTLSAANWFTSCAQTLACGMLWDDNANAYQALTLKSLKLVADSRQTEPLRRMAKIASLAAHPYPRVRQTALAYARKARELDKDDNPWTPMVLGMALFRNGEHTEAQEVLMNDELGGPTGGPSAYYRAMSLLHLNMRDEAHTLFTAAEEAMETLPATGIEINKISSDELIVWLAYKEAGALLGLPLKKEPKPAKAGPVSPAPEKE